MGQKRPKISKEMLYQNVECGGLKLRETYSFMQALKVTWIKRLLISKGPWKVLVKDLEKVIELDILSLKGYARKTLNPFWKDVLQAWIKYCETCETESSVHDILRLPLWDTHFTANNNLKMLGRKLYKNGCVKVKDLIDNSTLKFYEREVFVRRYQCQINYLDYATLLRSIPKQYTDMMCNVTNDDLNISPESYRTHVCKLLSVTKVCNMVYWRLINVKKPKCIDKWCQELAISNDEDIWKKYFKVAYEACMDTKMRIFQWKILHRSIVTNSKLLLFGIYDNNLCTFCHCKEETLVHLFIECKYVQELWSKLIDWLHPNIVLQKEMEPKDLLFGVVGYGENQLMNLILILYKRYIYVSRCYKQSLSFEKLLNFIKDYYKHETWVNQQYSNTDKKVKKKWDVLICKVNN